MAKNQNEQSDTIKSTFLFNYTKRPPEQKERINAWFDAQYNKVSSIISLIDHCIERFGYEDVTSHEIQQRLFKERLYFDDENQEMVLVPVDAVKDGNSQQRSHIQQQPSTNRQSEPQQQIHEENQIDSSSDNSEPEIESNQGQTTPKKFRNINLNDF
ncbi:hypothetical protein [Terribacillus saccharophilus]|uniref:hypothetical protein n=1 Tax=Terribacillus saccharophilus TaxID=361277 RepID=UPI002989EC95|nr:hypothetical protein [Terribacillus saccharophilus]MCM3227565.1 hypothetical protein [Terribacillus saccharophilus]